MLNVVCLVGRIVAQPELRYLPNSNVAVCSFRIAVDRNFKDQNGNKQTDFIDCVAWRQTAEYLANYVDKGRLLSVEGSLQVRSWQAQDGTNRKTVEVKVDSIHTLDRKPTGDTYQQNVPAVVPPDPFSATEGIPDWSGSSTNSSNDNMNYDPFSDD